MKQKMNGLGIALGIIFLIGFNVVFFLLATKRNEMVWISYGFIHFAYLTQLFTGLLTAKSKSTYVFGMAIGTISYFYFLAELITGAVFIIIATDAWKLSLAIHVVNTCIYAVLLISALIANAKTAEEENRSDAEAQYIRDASHRLAVLMQETSDMRLKKTIERAFDLLHGSPARSDPSVMGIEQEILFCVSAIENAVAARNEDSLAAGIGELQRLVAARNMQLRQLQS